MKAKFVASNQTRGKRFIGSYPLTQDGQQITVDIPRGPHIESVLVRVAGSANITTTFASVRSNAVYRFLRKADWVQNSNATLDSVSGTQLAQLYFTRRNLPLQTVPAGFGISVQPFEASYIFDRSLQDMMRPKDSMQKTDFGLSNNQMRLQFGNLSDMFTGAGVASYTNVTASVSVIDYQEAQDENGNTPSPNFYVKRNGFQVAIAAAANGQQVKLSTGNRLRAVSIRVLDATTLEPNIALLSRVRVKRAGDTRVDMPTTDLLRMNQADYGIALLTGQVVVDFAYDGALTGVFYSEFWPIPTSADTFLEVDTTAACVLEIATLEGVDLVAP